MSKSSYFWAGSSLHKAQMTPGSGVNTSQRNPQTPRSLSTTPLPNVPPFPTDYAYDKEAKLPTPRGQVTWTP